VSFNQIYPFPREPTEYDAERVVDMIKELHPSLRALVKHVKRLATDTEIKTCLAAKQIIRIASDGGAIPGSVIMDGLSKSV
jgi:rhamnose utilization protein RhaD (predicted bifunctional aldolase and dehydrogenase)